MKKSSKIRKKN